MSPISGSQVTVLIADDHEPTRAEMRRAIDVDDRFRVCDDVSDAPGAVAAALRERPDICLLDVRMPGSGLAAAWEIGAQLPECKVVMLTVSDDDRDVMVALSSGVAGYLLKSIDRQRLPHALWDVHQGTFAIPRVLLGNVVERMRDTGARRRSVELPHGRRLTSREWEVLDLLADGLTTREVAERLTLSTTGVRVHVAAAVKKLGVDDRDEAIALFRRTYRSTAH
jgi:DNA-binding NarL/FixJ family response regulator